MSSESSGKTNNICAQVPYFDGEEAELKWAPSVKRAGAIGGSSGLIIKLLANEWRGVGRYGRNVIVVMTAKSSNRGLG